MRVVEVGTVEKILSEGCGKGMLQLKVEDLPLLKIGLAWYYYFCLTYSQRSCIFFYML
jgi:hypothetical protein